jgi:hypothetical protein
MYRIISFIFLFSFVSVMLYLHNQNGHYHVEDHHQEIHEHKQNNFPNSLISTVKELVSR